MQYRTAMASASHSTVNSAATACTIVLVKVASKYPQIYSKAVLRNEIHVAGWRNLNVYICVKCLLYKMYSLCK